jgi:PAS domain-containing protein
MGPVLLIAILVLARWEFDVELSFIFVLSAIVILISIIWFYAVLLNQRGAQRKEAVDELIRIKKVEEELRREQYLLRTLIDNLPDNIYAKDKDLKYTISNRAHAKMMGVHSRY